MRLNAFRSSRILPLLACVACARPAPAPAPVAPPEPPPAPPPVIVTGAELDTLGEILRLEDRREFEAGRFQSWARAQSALVRRHAALGAGRIGNTTATTLLLGLLADADSSVRADAAFALGELGDSSSTVIQALAQASQRSAVAEATEAVAALGRLAADQGFPAVAAILSTGQTPAPVRQEALLAMARFPRRPQTFDLLLPSALDSAFELHWRAVYAMTRGPADPRAVTQLVGWLSDSSALVRALAARGLRAATADSADARAQAAAALTRALEDPHPHVRINAARSLASYHDQAHVAPLAARLRDEDLNVTLATAESLGELSLAAQDLRATANDSMRPLAVRNAALNSLLRIDVGGALDVARRWQESSLWLQRLYAVRLLAGARSQNVLDELRRASADPDARVAAAALGALAADTASAPSVLFIEKLAHRDPGVRAAALRGLQRRSNAGDLELFLQAYQRALPDTQRVAQLAAVDALGALARRGVPAARSFFLRFRRPPDPLLHQRIVDRLGPGDWGPVRPIETGRNRSFYRQVAHRYWHPDSVRARPRVRVNTAAGSFIIELLPHHAPLTVLNFLALVERSYFNDGRWHRVVPNFVLQDGDPRGDGSGGPGYAIRDEINRLRYGRGTVGMALSGPDTGGSQWFITHAPQPHLDGGYTIFGQVIEGMDVADRVLQDDPILSIEVIQ